MPIPLLALSRGFGPGRSRSRKTAESSQSAPRCDRCATSRWISERFVIRGVPPGDYELFAWEAIAPFAHLDSNFLQQFELKGTPVKVFASSRIAAEVETGVQFVTRAISLLFLNSRLYGAFPVWSFERSGLFSVSSFRARRIRTQSRPEACHLGVDRTF